MQKIQKNNLPENEKRQIIITCIVENGTDTGYCGNVSGELINKLEDVLEEIITYKSKNN